MPNSYILQSDGSYALEVTNVGGGGSGTLAQQVQGNSASGTTTATNPVTVSGVGSSSIPAVVTAGQKVNLWASLAGAVIVGGTASNLVDNNALASAVMADTLGTGGRALAVNTFLSGSSNTWDRTRSVTWANNTQATGTMATGEPLWSGSDTTQAAITFATSGDNTIVTAVAAQTTRVYRMYIVVGAATNITIKNGAGTALTGAFPLAANGAISLTFSGRPYFKTSVNTAFIINSSAAVQVSGFLDYVTSA